MRKRMRDLTPGDLVVPDLDHPNDVRTVESITLNVHGVKVWTTGSKYLTVNPAPLDTEVEVADPAPQVMTSWCTAESTWYINVRTDLDPSVLMSLSINDRLVFDGQDKPAGEQSGQSELVLRIRQHWIQRWRELAEQSAASNRVLIPFTIYSKAIEAFGRRRFAAGVSALLSFLDDGETTPELEKMLQLAMDENQHVA